jgi:protein-disulfide isomerase
MNEKKILLGSTFLLSVAWIILVKIHELPSSFSVDVNNQFTFGNKNAPVHMIIFQEFACPMCRNLHTEVLPQIEKTYLEKNQVKITIIPLAFLNDSVTACTLSLCIQKIAPLELKAFYDFTAHLPYEDLISFSFRDFVSAFIEIDKNLPAPQILKNLRDSSFEEELEKNLELATKIYPGDKHVPIVLINGKLIKDASLKSISKAIDEAL